MGANDNCHVCGQPLDFFNYYMLCLFKMNGLEKGYNECTRFCTNCVAFTSEESRRKFEEV